MFFTGMNKYRDFGLLLLRLGIGGMFVWHGAPKILGGVEKWSQLGTAMKSVGIEFLPAFWGFMAAVAELGGGICLILGLFVRPACLLLAITMGVAAAMHLDKGDGLRGASHAVEAAVLFFSLIFIGPGRYSLDEAFAKRRSRRY